MSDNGKYYSPSEIDALLKDQRNVYFIGIGGVSMSSLARICTKDGYNVGGSDRTRSQLTDDLKSEGIEVHIGHSADNASGFTVFVYNAAINDGNPEYRYARDNGYDLIYRADFLGYIIAKYENSIGVAGTHGKSTTTGMISEIFMHAKRDPTILNGADIPSLNGSYRQGGFENLVFEACEYKDSFLSFFPSCAVILNCELDHVDYFGNFENYVTSFIKYAQSAKHSVVINSDCDAANDIVNDLNNVIRCGTGKSADVRAENITYIDSHPDFDVFYKGEPYCHITLGVCGFHNISNALCACGVAVLYGIDGKHVAASLSDFHGVGRRFEYKKTCNGAKVFDDYAHHPTEIRATLDSAARICTGRLFCVFQSHTYTRTKGLFDDFTSSFGKCFQVIFADIYPARETDTLGMSGSLLAERTENGVYIGNFEQIAEYIKNTVREDDIVVVMGAGDINRLTQLL